MKRLRNNRPEPRTELIGLNLTDADLARLDELFAALKPTSPRQGKPSTFHTKHSRLPMLHNRPRSRASRQTFSSTSQAIRLGFPAQTGCQTRRHLPFSNRLQKTHQTRFCDRTKVLGFFFASGRPERLGSLSGNPTHENCQAQAKTINIF